MVEYLASTDCILGASDNRATIMYVGLFYSTMLQELWQHPNRMSLVGAVAAFCELVDGADVFPVDRERWADMRTDPNLHIGHDTAESIDTVFSLSFYEVGTFAPAMLP